MRLYMHASPVSPSLFFFLFGFLVRWLNWASFGGLIHLSFSLRVSNFHRVFIPINMLEWNEHQNDAIFIASILLHAGDYAPEFVKKLVSGGPGGERCMCMLEARTC